MSKPIVLIDSDGVLLCLPSAYSKLHLTPPSDMLAGKVPALYAAECVQALREVATVHIIGRNLNNYAEIPSAFLEYLQHALKVTSSEIRELCDSGWTLMKSYDAYNRAIIESKHTYYIVGQVAAYTRSLANTYDIPNSVIDAGGYSFADGLYYATLEVLERIAFHESLQLVGAGNSA